MSTILGVNGRPMAEPTAPPVTRKPASQDASETRDVRLVPTGVLMLNLCLCANGLRLNRMTLDQVEQQMKAQRVITDPPEVTNLRAVIEHQFHARDVMVGELDYRFKAIDERRAAESAAADATTPSAGDAQTAAEEAADAAIKDMTQA